MPAAAAVVNPSHGPAEVVRAVAEVFGSPEGVRVRRLPGATQADVFGVQGPAVAPALVVRLVRRPLEPLQRHAVVVTTLAARGARVSRIFENLPRDDVVFQFTERIDGVAPRADDPAHTRRVGGSLARLHRAAAGCEELLGDRPLRLLSLDEIVRSLDIHPEVLGLVRAKRRDLQRWEEELRPQLPSQLMHGDVHRHNVLISAAGAVFIDFDKMMIGPRVFDVAKYIATSCFSGRNEVRLEAGSVAAFLAGYASVSPLSRAEIAAVDALCVLLAAESNVWARRSRLPSLEAMALGQARWWLAGPGRSVIDSRR